MTGEAVVLMPAYNAGSTLIDAVLSLFPAQTEFDILIVDDGSTVPVADLLNTSDKLGPYLPRIHILRHEPNQGLIASLNKGIAWALERNYRYIIRMDSDDLARPGRIDKQIAFMDARPELDASGFQVMRFKHTFGDYGERTFPLEQDKIRRQMHVSGGFSHPALIMRADALSKVGLYDPRYLHAEDFDWTWRCMRKGRMANLPDFLLDYRISPNQVSAKNRRRQLFSKARVLLRETMRGELGCLIGLAMVAAVLIMPLHLKLALQNKLKQLMRRHAAHPRES